MCCLAFVVGAKAAFWNSGRVVGYVKPVCDICWERRVVGVPVILVVIANAAL